MSRWANWSRGSKPNRYLSDFITEGPVDPARTGNPTGTGTLSPADRARQLGLQSNGKGGYVDPQTGQVVARTVNNELVFYSAAPGGGAVSDGSGGSAAANPSSSWQDPISGLMTTPPGQPETPNEIAAVPDPVPAQTPAGYNAFITQRKQELYVQDHQARMQQDAQPPAPPELDPDMEEGLGDGMQENYRPTDLASRMAAAVDKLQANSGQKPEMKGKDMSPAQQNATLGIQSTPVMNQNRKTLDQFMASRRPGSGRERQAAFDQAQDPGNAPGVEKAESDRQAASVEDPAVERALNMTDPNNMGMYEALEKQRLARQLAFDEELLGTKKWPSSTDAQENGQAIAMMHALHKGATSGDETLFQQLMANYPDLAKKPDWYETFTQVGDRIREHLGMEEGEVDEDWAVEKTSGGGKLNFIDSENQQDFMQHVWNSMGQDVRNMYGNQLDSFNPADLTFARKTQLDTMKKGVSKIAEGFKDMPELMPGVMEAYMAKLEEAGLLHRASMKQGDTDVGVDMKTKPVNTGKMKGFDIDYDEDGTPRVFTGGFLEGGGPKTNLGLTRDPRTGQIGFADHSMMMSPQFAYGDTNEDYDIENKVGSLIGDPMEIRELPEKNPEAVPWKGLKPGKGKANARGGGIPVAELGQLIKDLTGEDINFRTGIRNKRNKKGEVIQSQYEPDEFTDDDKQYWTDLITGLQGEKNDDDSPFFDFKDGTNIDGDQLEVGDYVSQLFDMANTGERNGSPHETKFVNGLRTKLRQLRFMKAMSEARKKGPGEFAKLLAKLKYMAKKQGIDGDMTKGGYTLYQ